MNQIYTSFPCIIIIVIMNILIFLSLKKRNTLVDRRDLNTAVYINNNYKNCSKANQIIKNSKKISNYFRENDDVYGKCKFSHPICQLNAKCTKKQSFISGCLATGIDKYGRITDFGCPAKCCNYES
mgnify:CR=1 FL=1